jgi:hypothetical protein
MLGPQDLLPRHVFVTRHQSELLTSRLEFSALDPAYGLTKKYHEL